MLSIQNRKLNENKMPNYKIWQWLRFFVLKTGKKRFKGPSLYLVHN